MISDLLLSEGLREIKQIMCSVNMQNLFVIRDCGSICLTNSIGITSRKSIVWVRCAINTITNSKSTMESKIENEIMELLLDLKVRVDILD